MSEHEATCKEICALRVLKLWAAPNRYLITRSRYGLGSDADGTEYMRHIFQLQKKGYLVYNNKDRIDFTEKAYTVV
jgi:hypothetical protein